MIGSWKKSGLAYLNAVLVVGAAAAVRMLLVQLADVKLPFMFFFPAIIVAALFGGFRAGIFATVLSAVFAAYWMEPAGGPTAIPTAEQITIQRITMALFLLISVVMVTICDRMRQARTAAETAASNLTVSEARFRNMADFAPVMIWMCSPDQRRTWFNKPWLDFTGRTLEEELSSPWDEHLHPDDRIRTRDAYAKAFDARQPSSLEFRVKRRDGEYRWLLDHGVPLSSPTGELLGFVGSCIDITDRKQAEEALANSERVYRAIGESNDYGVWVCDPAGHNVYTSESFLKLTGLTQSECSSFGWATALHPDDYEQTVTAWQRCVATESPWYREHRVRGVDGLYHPVLARGVPVRNDQGEIVAWAGINLDIGQLKEAEAARERLLESERAARNEAERAGRMKDEFLATLSHELRTPLNAILGFAQLLNLDPAREEQRQEGLEIIERNARVQAQLIDDLLDMNRIVSGKLRLDMQPLELVPIVAAALKTVTAAADARNITIESNASTPLPLVMGDPNRLQQIAWNILSNAIKFTPVGGRVRVHIEQVDGQVELRVTDSGQGIDPEFLPFVFERFRQADASITRRHGGLGLGLSIVKQLVELHGGTVRAESVGAGHGATFIVSLPVEHARPVRRFSPLPDGVRAVLEEMPPVARGTLLAGVRVIVVDDDRDSCELLRRVLSDCQAEVTTVTAASEVLDTIDRVEPDLLISDIGMPHQDGYELIRQIRARGAERYGDVPALALTAFARAEDRARAIEAGYQMHLAKPVEPLELVNVAARLTGRTAGELREEIGGSSRL